MVINQQQVQALKSLVLQNKQVKCKVCQRNFSFDDKVLLDGSLSDLIHKKCDAKGSIKQDENAWRGVAESNKKWSDFVKCYEAIQSQFYNKYGYYDD